MTDAIVKTTILRAPLARVWRAISDAAAFGAWFGMALEGPFVEGTTVVGAIAPTQVDDDLAARQAPHAGARCVLHIERVVAPRLLAFRWHPGADADAAPGAPTTLVTFALEEVDGGTRLTVTESGFDALPPERRAHVFRQNEGGWTAQLTLIAKYLARGA